jgi:cytochrome c55X
MPGLVLTASAAEPSTQRQAELLHLLQQDCGSCHGFSLRGGLGPPLLPATLAPSSDEMLSATILHGRPGTPMPPWAFEIAPAEADWLVRRLRDGISHAP